MISGDNLETAKKCALDCGILTADQMNDSDRAMTAYDFREKIGFEEMSTSIARYQDENGVERLYFNDGAV